MLGFLIGRRGIACNPDKVESITSREPPRDLTEVRSFLTGVGYFRRTIESFTSLAAPMYVLLKKGQAFDWTEECATAFLALKQCLKDAAVVKAPDWNESFIMSIRVTEVSIGANLFQLDRGLMILRPVYFCSRKLKDYGTRYNLVEKHMLALVLGVTKLGHYLYGKPFRVLTSYPGLHHVMNFPCRRGRIAKWIALLSPFEFTVEEKLLAFQRLEHGTRDVPRRRWTTTRSELTLRLCQILSRPQRRRRRPSWGNLSPQRLREFGSGRARIQLLREHWRPETCCLRSACTLHIGH